MNQSASDVVDITGDIRDGSSIGNRFGLVIEVICVLGYSTFSIGDFGLAVAFVVVVLGSASNCPNLLLLGGSSTCSIKDFRSNYTCRRSRDPFVLSV